MPICEVCRHAFKEWHIDDHLHSTNWNLPNLRTGDVCSDGCQKIFFAQYELTKQIALQQEKGRIRIMQEAIERVKTRIHDTPFINISDQEIRSLYYDLRSALDLDEDYD